MAGNDIENLSTFTRALAEQLMALTDTGTGRMVGLTPWELEEVGVRLQRHAQRVIRRTMRQLGGR